MEEVLINGKVCKRLDSGTNNRATLIDVTSVPDVKVNVFSRFFSSAFSL